MRRAGAVRVLCGCRAGAVRVPCGGVRPIASVHDEDDPVGHDVQVVSGVDGGVSAIFKRLDYDMQCSCPGADPGGGGGGGKAPIFWGGGNKGAKNDTQRTKNIKIGRPRSKIQAKTYPKTH